MIIYNECLNPNISSSCHDIDKFTNNQVLYSRLLRIILQLHKAQFLGIASIHTITYKHIRHVLRVSTRYFTRGFLLTSYYRRCFKNKINLRSKARSEVSFDLLKGHCNVHKCGVRFFKLFCYMILLYML